MRAQFQKTDGKFTHMSLPFLTLMFNGKEGRVALDALRRPSASRFSSPYSEDSKTTVTFKAASPDDRRFGYG